MLSSDAGAVQVTALGLINAAGKTGAIPTGVQFALKGMSAPSVSPSSMYVQAYSKGTALCHGI